MALFACTSSETDDSDVARDLVAEVTTFGSYNVGFSATTFTYPDPDGEGDRELALSAWYPTNATTGAEVRYQGLFVAEGVYGDAPVADGQFPVVVFSHGHQGFAENSSFLMRFFASHGYVVFAPNHTGNTTFDGSGRTTEIYYQRPADISAVLDRAEALTAADPLFGHLGDEKLLMGHSFGGYTAYALAGASYDLATLLPACEAGTGPSDFCSTMTETAAAKFAQGFTEPRFDAAITMAPGDFSLFGAAGVNAVALPTLFLYGTLDPNTDSQRYREAMTHADEHRIELQGAGHQTFTDFSGILETGDGLMEAERGFRVIDAYTFAFAEMVRGDTAMNAVLDGELLIDEAAVLR